MINFTRSEFPRQNRLLRSKAGPALMLLTAFSLFAESGAAADDATDLFERSVRPLLIEHCVACHGPEKQESGLRLDSRQQVLTGAGDVAALVIPGNPDDSRLLQVLLYSEEDIQMPPKGPLNAVQKEAVRKWIALGAAWPEEAEFGSAAAHDPDSWRTHWAFQPVRPPAISDDSRHPVDVLVARVQEGLGVGPAPLADGGTLVRRTAFVLTGLLPAVPDLEQSASWMTADDVRSGHTAYAERLLESPQFGERWARHWMDIARYSDTKGYVFRESRDYPDAWRYRRWLINAFNADMPWDDFIRKQIAADLMEGGDERDNLVALGYLTLGRRFLNNRQDIIDDRIDVVSRGMLGLTVACARCHDHKFDPIPTADYYSLYGVFDSTDEPGGEPTHLRLSDREQPREPVIFIRGSNRNRGPRVPRRFLTALAGPDAPAYANGSGRLELAEDIASEDNPLTARVAVNRIWMHSFGKPLVDTPSDFGVRTEKPVQHELLDHLAYEFVRHNWSVKWLLRHLLTSDTWRRSSLPAEGAQERDPENRAWSWMPRRRRDFESHRDVILQSAGRLDLSSVGGPPENITETTFGTRRSVYAFIDRQNLPGLFRTFDLAGPDSHAPQRFETTVPQQALFQMNSGFMQEQCTAAAERAAGEAAAAGKSGQGHPGLVSALYRNILGRTPDETELTACVEFLRASAAVGVPAEAGWQYGIGALNSDDSFSAFQRLPLFHENAWKGGETLPAEKYRWAMLSREGGHSGPGGPLTVSRRWIPVASGTISIRSEITHPAGQGDGVRAAVFVNGQRVTDWLVAFNGTVRLDGHELEVEAGSEIDFVTDCRSNESHDSFRQSVRIEHIDANGHRVVVDSRQEFDGRQGVQPLTPEGLLAQVLMCSNEFVFVD